LSATNPAPRLLFYVQHLLGIGHMKRSERIASALAAEGFDVHIAQGGHPVNSITFPGCTIHPLPAIKTSGADFGGLIDQHNQPVDDAYKALRTESLLTLAQLINPDVLLLELYPFGRRQMRFELKPLLRWCQQQPKAPMVVSSVRDILQIRKPEREQESLQLLKEYFTDVIVHGDPEFVSLNSSFRLSSEIEQLTYYSGYVAPKPVNSNSRRGVIVSAGGGAVGEQLLDTALTLAQQTASAESPWTLITGPNLDQVTRQRLEKGANAYIKICTMLPDFTYQLAHCEASVSQAGYNTVMDLLATDTAAVLVPFVGSGETEQTTRAELLAQHGWGVMLAEEQLTPATLQRALKETVKRSHQAPKINLDGATNTAIYLMQRWKKHGSVA